MLAQQEEVNVLNIVIILYKIWLKKIQKKNNTGLLVDFFVYLFLEQLYYLLKYFIPKFILFDLTFFFSFFQRLT